MSAVASRILLGGAAIIGLLRHPTVFASSESATSQSSSLENPILPHVFVIGSGVIGLTTAKCLKDRGYKVTIWTDKHWCDTVSNVAGGLWEPFLCGPEDKVIEWSKRTLDYYKRECADGHHDRVDLYMARNYYPEKPVPPYWACVPEDFTTRTINSWEGPKDYRYVCEFMTAIVSPSRYMHYLQTDLEESGVKFEQRQIHSIDHAISLARAAMSGSLPAASRPLPEKDVVKHAQSYPTGTCTSSRQDTESAAMEEKKESEASLESVPEGLRELARMFLLTTRGDDVSTSPHPSANTAPASTSTAVARPAQKAADAKKDVISKETSKDDNNDLIQAVSNFFAKNSSENTSDKPTDFIVVNCTGGNGGELSGDNSVFPVMGKVVVLETPGVDQCVIVDRGPLAISYIIPRPDGTSVVGGCFDANAVASLPTDEEIEDLRYRAGQAAPTGFIRERVLKGALVGRYTGLRPCRKVGVRLEAESHPLKDKNARALVVHHYGHGGSGWTVCWGASESAADLVDSEVKK